MIRAECAGGGAVTYAGGVALRARSLGDDAVDLGGAVSRTLTANEDIAGITPAEEVLRDLAGHFLQVEDEERRRIARGLHDITAQNLVAALLTLERLRQASRTPDGAAEDATHEIRALLERSLQEIRTLSYLLHPPLLDELGLEAALRSYVRGFENRSRIAVSLTVEESLPRLSSPLESALFRVVQEALTNIHRHSGSATAEIRLARSSHHIMLEIRDHGRGMTADVDVDDPNVLVSLGMGLSGMRARLQQFAGRLEIRSTERGTLIRAILPLERRRSLLAAEGRLDRSPAA